VVRPHVLSGVLGHSSDPARVFSRRHHGVTSQKGAAFAMSISLEEILIGVVLMAIFFRGPTFGFRAVFQSEHCSRNAFFLSKPDQNPHSCLSMHPPGPTR
jgi:hypothetical protein